MLRAIFLALFISLVSVGCATAHKMNNISIGMTKNQVIETLGKPSSTSAKEGVEFLSYRFSETDDDAFMGYSTRFFVRIIEGKVDSYGRLGDFDSTKVPETKSTIDLNIRK